MIGIRCARLASLFKSSSRHVTVPSFKGRATIAGTYDFIRKSKLPLHHELAISKLTINPIIHGPPKNYSSAGKNTTYMEALTRRAIVKNRSNCVVVYQYHEGDEPWYSTNLDKLFLDPKNDVKRENVVTVAHLGFATTREDILQRLYDACRVTRLDVIDMVFFEVTENTSQFMLDETMMTLEDLACNDKIQSYGVHVSVAPYVYHNPPFKQTGPLQTLPLYIENWYVDKFKHADMVMYPISPTTAIPTTYPMLDPSEADADQFEDSEEEDTKKSDEATRTFTRIAIHPLTCKLGGKAAYKYENPAIWEARAELEAQIAADRAAAAAAAEEGEEEEDGEEGEGSNSGSEEDASEDSDGADNSDHSDEELGDEEEEKEEVEEEEVEVVAPRKEKKKEYSAEKKKLLAKLQRMDPDFTMEDLDSDSDDNGAPSGSDAKDGTPSQSQHTRSTGSSGPDFSNGAKAVSGSTSGTGSTTNATATTAAGASAPGVLERELVEVDLMNSLHDQGFEQVMIEALDEVCPPLKSTPLLEDKALRIVLSVGIDCVMVDAERSAMLGRLRLKPTDMLSCDQTDDVFSRFCLPNPDDPEYADLDEDA